MALGIMVLARVEFGNQFFGRCQTISAKENRFDFCPIDLRRIELQAYPAEMTSVFWDMKSIVSFQGAGLTHQTECQTNPPNAYE
jgi:hypothetical protein